MARHAIFDTTLGLVTLVAEAAEVTGLYFMDHKPAPPARLLGVPVDARQDDLLVDVARQLRAYLAGERTRFEVAIAEGGTPFQQRVWAYMHAIPYGETTTYGAIARALGNPGLSRAVGTAVSRNPVCILAPCHRIIAAGGLGGYAGGLERKQALLTLEGSRW